MKPPEQGPRPQEAGAETTEAKGPEEGLAEQLSPEQMDQATYWLQQMAAELEAKKLTEKPLGPTERETKAAELNEIFETWLTPEKLGALHALTTEAEAMASPLRAEAKSALGEIRKRIDPSSEDRYKLLSRAVGMINGGKVDHTR